MNDPSTTFVVGASGANGKQLVEQLLASSQNSRILVRPGSQIPERWQNHKHVSIIRG